ncbi:MAG: hypothetical protein SAJ37_20475 [Oscillatoria sp. PMC 1068.18]|nr:hypothetical protein [Oscillatoria sp. PMC 1076.18]MEC4991116.1 hypothetical protein [Oscillatoria sp. PMC 1068.18]
MKIPWGVTCAGLAVRTTVPSGKITPPWAWAIAISSTLVSCLWCLGDRATDFQ